MSKTCQFGRDEKGGLGKRKREKKDTKKREKDRKKKRKREKQEIV